MDVSLNFEFWVGNVFSLIAILSNVEESDAAAWRAVSETSEGDATQYEFFGFGLGHVRSVVGVDITPDESASWATESPVSGLEVPRWIDLINLVALVGVPAAADHTGR